MMRDIIKRIFYRILLFIDHKTTNAKVYYLTKSVILGQGSQVYKETNIFNMQKNMNQIRIGNNSHIRGELLVLAYGGEITIGDNSFVGTGSKIWSGEKISIGSNVLISHNVNIIDTNSHETDANERAEGYKNLLKNGYPVDRGSIKTAKIVVGDYAWINFNAVILKGVTIGEGAIIAAGSVVTKDVAAWTVVGGNPAQFIKSVKDINT